MNNFLNCTYPQCRCGKTEPCKPESPATPLLEIEKVFEELKGENFCPEWLRIIEPIQCDQSRIKDDVNLKKFYHRGVSAGRSEVGGIPNSHSSCILNDILALTDTKRQHDIVNAYCFGLAVGASTAKTQYYISQIEDE